MHKWMLIVALAIAGASVACRAGGPSTAGEPRVATGDQPRPLRTVVDGKWIGNGISYGPYRDGQAPGTGRNPTREQMLEDLRVLSKHWHLLRVYGSTGPAEDLLAVIRAEKIDMQVMVGAWIAPETHPAPDGQRGLPIPDVAAANRSQIDTAIRLANEYPEIVFAISVGNETQVSWSSHKVRQDVLIDYVREVRAKTSVPVTVADDFSFWNLPRSRPLAREVDFIVTHAYAMWWGRTIDQAMDFTQQKYAEVVAMHPDRVVVLGEAGWATKRHTEGDQAKLIAGVAGEPQQKRYFDECTEWTTAEHVVNFYFEAFDENWKGGPHPDEIEKHWGLFNADRTPKQAMQGDG